MKRRSAQWGCIRNHAPVMPWDDDPSARVFPSLAAQKGTTYALRMWDYLQELAAIAADSTADDDTITANVRAFFARVRDESPEDAAALVEVYRLCRTVAGGYERQRVARSVQR